MRVAVYGNLIYDQIITLDEPLVPGNSHTCVFSYSAGGIANFCRAAHGQFEMAVVSRVGQDNAGQYMAGAIRKYSKLHIPTYHMPTTCASVIVDKAQSVRTGMVQWGICSQMGGWAAIQADWHHIMYLDRINITAAEIQAMEGMVSADVCDIDNLDRSLLSHIDLLIASKPTTWSVNPSDLPTRKGGILHSPELIQFSIDRGDVTHLGYQVVAREEKLNVVGAGDYLAAYSIAHLLQNDSYDAEAVHELTLAMIKRQS